MDAVYIISREGKLIDMNKALLELFGYTREEMLKLDVLNIYVNPEDRKKFLEVIDQRKSVSDYEVKFRKKDGTEIDCLLTSTVRWDSNWNITGYQGIIRDITERKKLERQLIESEEKFRILVEKDPNMVYLMNEEGKFSFVNRAILDTVGYSQEELYDPNFDINSLIAPKHRQMVIERMKQRFAGEKVPESYEFSILTKQGKTIPILINVASLEIDGKRVIEGVMTEVSEVKTLEKELKESEERYRGLFESSIDGITSVDMDGNIIECNQSLADILGYTKEELYQSKFQTLMPTKWFAKIAEILKEQIIPRGYSDVYEIEAIKKDGTIIPVSTRSWLIKDKDGNLAGTWAVVRDITKRKRAEELSKESEEKLQAILTGIGDRISIYNRDLDIIWVNQPVKNIWRDVIGKKCYEEYKSLDEPCPDCYVEKVFKEGKTEVTEREIILSDGKLNYLLITSSPIKDAEGNIVAVVDVVKDITERKNAEEKIKEYSENLEQMIEERTNALRESEEKLQAILMGIGDLITIQNRDLDIIWINQAERGIYGDVVGRKCYAVYKGLTAPCPNCTVETVFDEGKALVTEGMVIKPDGQPIHILTTSSPMKDAEGNIVAVVETVKDITERKELERQLKDYTENLEKIVEERTQALSESEAKLQGILSGIGDLITIQSRDLDIIWVNQPIRDLWGDVIGKKCYEEYKSLDKPCPDCTAEKVFSDGKSTVSERTSILPDGSEIQIFTTSSPMRDADGNIVAVVETIKDISDRKRAEKLSKESEEKYSTIVEQGNDGIAIGQNGKLKFVNSKLLGLFGYTLEETLEKPFTDFIAPESRELVLERYKMRMSGEKVPDRFEIEI
ncbi:MAG: PAS domain-containing protein, partial [Candidatus Hodarchaeales archaeon]